MKRLFATMLVAVAAIQTARADIWEELITYELGQEKVVPAEIEKLVAAMPAEQLATVEAQLLRVIGASNATEDARGVCCRMLQRPGRARPGR